MRLFRPKKTMNIGITTDLVIFKGQLFFVDTYLDLPANFSTPEVLKENWEELELHNNYGTVKLVQKI